MVREQKRLFPPNKKIWKKLSLSEKISDDEKWFKTMLLQEQSSIEW